MLLSRINRAESATAMDRTLTLRKPHKNSCASGNHPIVKEEIDSGLIQTGPPFVER